MADEKVFDVVIVGMFVTLLFNAFAVTNLLLSFVAL